MVISTGIKTISYDFSDKESLNYGAYGGSVLIPSLTNFSQRVSELLPPKYLMEMNLLEVYKYSEFDNNQYLAIKEKNEGKYASTSKAAAGNTVFQYFKFKIKESKIHINSITPYWKGKIEGSANEIRLYIWNNSYTILGLGLVRGKWVEIAQTQ